MNQIEPCETLFNKQVVFSCQGTIYCVRFCNHFVFIVASAFQLSLSISFSHFNLFLTNYWTNWNQTWQIYVTWVVFSILGEQIYVTWVIFSILGDNIHKFKITILSDWLKSQKYFHRKPDVWYDRYVPDMAFK